MTLRNNIPAKKRLAHEILDLVRNGLRVEPSRVKWALIVLGDGWNV
jgi:hypothetical protein